MMVPLVIAVLLGLALMPSAWYGFTTPLHGTVVTLLTPLSLPFSSLESTLQMEREQPPLAGGDVGRLSDELRHKDALLIAAQRRITELERINAELQGLKARLGDSYVYRQVRVIGRSSDAAAGTLFIDEGAVNDLRVGLPAVDGANLVGRIVQISPTSSSIQPITSEGLLIEAVLAPPQLPSTGLPPERSRTVQLRAEGDQRLFADDVDRSIPVEVGDYARLYDSHGASPWPASVQGYILGVVSAVEPNPDDGLRKRVTVRPLISIQHVSAVTVIAPRDEPLAPAISEGSE